jgi:CheY-like chemotaxis protein
VRKIVLLVDDSIARQEALAAALAPTDVELITMDQGHRALKRARELRPDLILAAEAISGFSGYELCREVKRDAVLRQTPVLLVTGPCEVLDEQWAAEVDADGHLAYSFDVQVLTRQVEATLTQVHTAHDVPLTPERASEGARSAETTSRKAPTEPDEVLLDMLDYREKVRADYSHPVPAVIEKGPRILQGRDLTVEGMRVDVHPDLALGSRVQLALYGNPPKEPVTLDATVVRADDAGGLLLWFEQVNQAVTRDLEELVANLPPLEPTFG